MWVATYNMLSFFNILYFYLFMHGVYENGALEIVTISLLE